MEWLTEAEGGEVHEGQGASGDFFKEVRFVMVTG